MRTNIVTGGAGFIGSHLCESLLARGERVICVDSLLTGSEAHVRALRAHAGFSFMRQDIAEPLRIEGPVERIYNLACPASPPRYQADPFHTVRTNTVGVIALLELARAHRARLLQASTSEVYGDPLEHPQRETYRGNVNPIGPRACYDEGKRVAETLCFDGLRAHGTQVRVARIFNTYGPQMAPDDGRVVSNFIVQALAGEDLTVYGDGSQTRSFCYVSDMVRGLIALMESDATGPMNLGNPDERTVLEIAQRVLALTGSRSRIVHVALPQDDPVRRKPDIALAKATLGWEPQVTLEEGLKETVAYFRKEIGK